MKKIALIISIFLSQMLSGQDSTITYSGNLIEHFGKSIQILCDTTSELSDIEAMSSLNYKFAELEVPNLGVTTNTYWVKFNIHNSTQNEILLLDLRQSSLDEVFFFEADNSIKLDDRTRISDRLIQNQNYIFELKIPTNSTKQFFLKIHSGDQVQLPLAVGTYTQIQQALGKKDLYFGIYSGILFAMLLSAILIFIKTKDKIYVLYVGYVMTVFLTQANFQGYTLRFFWANNPEIERYSVYVFSAVVGIVGSVFIIHYLQIRKNAPWALKVFYAIFYIYPFVVIPAFFGYFNFSYNVLQMIASVSAFFVLYVAFYCWRRGNNQAGNLLVAWSSFLIGIVIFVLKDFGIVPYNTFTSNTMTIGSAVEGILLSFGLADKINQLKLEKEQANAERLRMIQSQNEILEVKVHERTAELEDAKERIQSQYDHLRMTQKQLVESEKLAGLGQMTAGIAHELNNPINFVSSNVGPLHRDIEDVVGLLNEYYQLPEQPTPEQIAELKAKCDKTGIDFVQKEIHLLLQGIEEGSKRTAEIVRGLRIFARADKDTLVPANINECLQSTLVVMKSITKGNVNLTKDIDSSMPFIECFPGKLNQVIANLISNAVQATKLPGRGTVDRHVHVRSWHDDNQVHISVKDNGCGIADSEKEKIFVPFYTTKSVGEGTGLGLSIAMGIVEEHGGEIEVISTPGEGSEFIVHLPRARKGVSLSAA
ncbi:MAG: GHKL domain-containing protein [Flavobacteriales bacterium]|nr:GHKL domain-containing protein [Flavobacteriales bacterium]